MRALKPVAQGATTLPDTAAHKLSTVLVQCEQIILQNDDGAPVNQNTGVVSVGTEDVGLSDGAILRPGAGLVVDCGSPSSLYVRTTIAPTTLRWTALG